MQVFTTRTIALRFFHHGCSIHTIVLSTKESIERMDGLPSGMVRMGHLHESGKTSAEHRQHLDDIVEERFRFHIVAVYPDGFAE